MLFLTGSFLTLFLALSITGSPIEVRNSPIIVPLTRRLDVSNATIDLLQHDKARAAAFMDYNTHSRRAAIIPTRFASSSKYTVALIVGNPPTTYDLLVDTGSAVTWITPYAESGRNTKQRVGEIYGGEQFPEKSFSGTFFIDTVTLGDGLTIPDYELAVASTKTNFERYDGVLGIGPRSLTLETLKDDPAATYPTFTDWLVTKGAIRQNIVGIFFKPVTKGRYSAVGELAFGEPDDTKCTSDIVYTDITKAPVSRNYWGIDLTITYRDVVILLPTAGIIATSREFIYIASYAFDWYRVGTGATFDEPTGLLRITPDQYGALGFLKFHIGNQEPKQVLTLIANAQIWPRSLNYKIHGAEDKGIYLIIKRLDEREKMGFIIGYTFMQRFYTVLDGDNRKVGFATTPFTYAVTNW
ncbi:aspartic peptidase domain-containing protein [Suillus spraguei]|nr:aspartic peptidase domain-containing protein [Suillus spraguei]